MSHTSTGGRRGIVASIVVSAAVIVTTAACGSQAGTDISDHGSTYSVPRHGAVKQDETRHEATSADAAERRGREKFTPPPAEIGIPR